MGRSIRVFVGELFTRPPGRPGVCLISFLVGCVVGCAPANPLGRIAISGNVTLDGQPMEDGTIEFAPESGGVGSGARIVGGHYAIEQSKGLPPGSYQVRIYSPRSPEGASPPSPAAPPGPEAAVLGIERVAEKYNARTTLMANVPANAEAPALNFDVSSR